MLSTIHNIEEQGGDNFPEVKIIKIASNVTLHGG